MHRILICAIGTVAVVLSGLTAQERTTPRPRGPVDETPIKELPPGKIVSRQLLSADTTLARLANGMTVIVREQRVAPVATARVYVRNTGSAYEGKYLGAGISHLTEHLVSGGATRTRTEQEIETLLDKIGAASNAYTSTDVTAYHVDTPARHVNVAIDVLADAMQNCIFPEASFRREYHVVQRELEMGEEERPSMLWQMLSELAYREHPLRHPIGGHLHVLQALKREDAVSFYRERYQPQNMTFVIVGDVQTDVVLEAVSKGFANFKRSAEVNLVLPSEPPVTSPRTLRREMEGELATLTLAWPTIPLEHPDLYALDLASFILGRGDSSRLSRVLRFEKNLVVTVQASSHTPAAAPGWFAVSMEVEPKNVASAQQAALDVVGKLRETLVSDQELTKAKKQMQASHVFANQSVADVAEMLAQSYHATGDPFFQSRYVERIQHVTAEDVRRVIRAYVVPDRQLLAIIDPPGTSAKQTAVTAKPVDDKVRKHVLPNGVTVLIKRSANVPLVQMQCAVRAGTLGETDGTNGVASLTADLMTRGTKTYNADQIAEFFDGVGGSIGAESGRNLSYVLATLLKDDFARAFDYFTEVALAPTFPADEFADRREERLLAIGQRRADAIAEASEFLHDQFPAGCALRRISGGRKETVARLKIEDVRAFHARYFVPQNMVVSVFGDVEPDKALALVQSRFGALARAPDFVPPTGQGLALDEPVRAHKATQRPDTAVVHLAFPGTRVDQSQENATIKVLGGILSGHDNAGGWLFTDLRGAGLVYVVQGNDVPGLVTGYYGIVAQTRPDQLDEALKRIKALLAKTQRGDITAEEVDRSKDALVNAHARQNETLGERALEATINEALGLGHDYDDGFAKRIAKVSLADVKAMAGKLFQRGIQVTTGPKSPAVP